MNKVILMGRLTRDPQTKTMPSNTMVANFTLAVKRRLSKENETDFISIVAWNKTAEFVHKYFKKGQQVSIVGRIQTRTYEDSKGQKKYLTEVIAEEVYFTGSKEKENQNVEFVPNFTQTEFDDDLPF